MGTGASNQARSRPGNVEIQEVSKSLPELSPRPTMGDSRVKTTHNENSAIQRLKVQKSPENTAVVSLSTQSLTKSNISPMRSPQTQAASSTSETGNSKLQKRIKELEQELTRSESDKLDLQDQVQALQQQVTAAAGHPSLSVAADTDLSYTETLHAKDQYISKLERDLTTAQSEYNKTCMKLKKRVKGLTKQLHEVRQEASISQMEMKAKFAQQNELLKESSSTSIIGSQGKGSDPNYETNGHSKIIVELSNQMSEQSEMIAKLESELVEKNARIEELEKAGRGNGGGMSVANGDLLRPSGGKGDGLEQVSMDRLHSSRGKRPMGNAFSHFDQSSQDMGSGSCTPVNKPGTADFRRPGLERQSTALSDSDSDWEVDSIPTHTQSAPARSRVKSAMSTSSAGRGKGDVVSMLGDDDSIIETSESIRAPVSTADQRVRPYKKSSLKQRLEQEKKKQQTNALMGPSLAFASKSKEPPSDTSCEPTPRYTDPSRLPGFSKLKVVHQPR